MLALVFWLAADLPSQNLPLQSPSPFSLHVQQDGDAVKAMIYNHTDHARTFLYDHRYQPAELLVRDADDHFVKVFAPPTPPPPGADPVYKKMYIKLPAKQSAWLDEGRVLGNAIERFVISFGDFRTPYLPPGRYFVSILWKSATAACFDCSDDEKGALDKRWHGMLRSNEVEVVLR